MPKLKSLMNRRGTFILSREELNNIDLKILSAIFKDVFIYSAELDHDKHNIVYKALSKNFDEDKAGATPIYVPVQERRGSSVKIQWKKGD